MTAERATEARRPPALVRHVYYIGGFYTGGPSFYRGTLVREAARHSRVRGMPIAVANETDGVRDELAPCYILRAERPEGLVETRYALLRWEDIVLDRLARPWVRRLAAGAATLADYLRNGAAWRMLRLSRRFGLMWLFPFVFYPAALLLSALAGLVVQTGLRSLDWGSGAFLAGLATSALVLLAASAFGRFNYAYLFLNNWIFSREIALDRTPEVWARLDAFAGSVARSLGKADEVVVIGHSFGASFAPLVVAAVTAPEPGARLTLLTLGASPAVIGLHPAARRFREGLQRAAASPGVTWIDVSSSYDALNFKRFDPIAGLGLANGKTRPPHLVDTRFARRSGGGFLRKLSLMRLHMQFIKAAESAESYDFIGLLTQGTPIAENRHGESVSPPGLALGDAEKLGGLRDEAAAPSLAIAAAPSPVGGEAGESRRPRISP